VVARHLQRVRELHQKDLAEGWGRVVLPYALNRKYKSASGELGWQAERDAANREAAGVRDPPA
jgi:hypothetical protein